MKVDSIKDNKDSRIFTTALDKEAFRELRIFAIDKGTTVRAVISEVVREGIAVIRKRDKLPD